MWLVNKVEIYFCKIGSMDCKWSNLNAPDLGLTHFWYTLWALHAGKGKCCMWLVNKVEIHFAKIAFMD